MKNMEKEIKCTKIHTLSEYTNVITGIANVGDVQMPEVLWFRGMDYSEHPIIPSLFRDEKLINGNNADNNSYSSVKYAEDIRTQHYIAKNYHSYEKLPVSRIEWLEVMQHHEARTRVLDWSESAIHSLLFAIEPFLNKKFNSQQRRKQFPCVWVLKPAMLNKYILACLKDEDNLVKNIFNDLNVNEDDIDKILKNIKSFPDFVEDKENKKGFNGIKHLKYIFNLSTINDEINQLSRSLTYYLKSNEYPAMFYLIKRIYGDGVVLENRGIPPIAINHPYHSERIKSQKGVFTVFPNYKDNDNDKNIVSDSKLRKAGFEPNAMQYNQKADKYLQKIRIMDPEKIAFELLAAGMNTSWLYPELPIIANEIEFHKIY